MKKKIANDRTRASFSFVSTFGLFNSNIRRHSVWRLSRSFTIRQIYYQSISCYHLVKWCLWSLDLS